jgi:parallel beta-helix repeat protein
LLKKAYSDHCITYNSRDNVIIIDCGSANLTGVYNHLHKSSILHKEFDHKDDKIWLLNANLTIGKGATLYINSTDTAWLKIISKGTKAYEIKVIGNLNVDSVKITSWNPKTNDYAKTTRLIKEPRGFIRATEGGAINITNSEIAYLGYDSGGIGTQHGGLTYIRSNGSVLRNNNIHHMWVGFFSDKSDNIVIENNHIHDDLSYGLDPHTGTHDMIIRNNTINNNGDIGIICSLNCYNITIENNTSFNNDGSGIMFSMNMHDSVARNNVLYNDIEGIYISESSHNQIYSNLISSSEYGIRIKDGIRLKDVISTHNSIYDNSIRNCTKNIAIESNVSNNVSNNTFYHNRILEHHTKVH